MNPEFRMFVGPMFGSKTTRLITAIERYRLQGKKVVVFKARIDNRYSENKIVTHSGWGIEANSVADAQEMAKVLNAGAYDVVAVDEAFMIEGCPKLLTKLYRKGKTVIVATLDLYHNAKPFEETKELLPWASHVEKCPAVCSYEGCSNDACFTFKTKDTGMDREVGGAELYEARCLSHHPIMNLAQKD